MSETIGTTTLFTTSSFSASPTLEPTSTATTTFEISPTTYNPPSNKGGGLSVGVVLPVILAVVFVLFGVSVYPCLRIRRRRRRRLHHAKYPHDHKNPTSYKAAVPMAVGAAAGMTAVAVATANDGHPAEVIVLSEAETAFGMPFGPDIKDPKDALEVAADVTAGVAYAGATTNMALSSAVLMTVTVAVTVTMMIVVAIAAIATIVALVVVMVPVVDRSTS
ncbi:hypothetical protein BGW42_006064 [Actinomortierella wolfii]|nr:hypothetical protein BGW42_006064 [Actinomortierella wolfii]